MNTSIEWMKFDGRKRSVDTAGWKEKKENGLHEKVETYKKTWPKIDIHGFENGYIGFKCIHNNNTRLTFVIEFYSRQQQTETMFVIIIN